MDRHAWELPGAHEETPGVFRIPLPLPGDHLKAVNVYAIADGEQVAMIDGGWALAQARELLAASLDSIGYGLADIREFLVTHVHRDHYTQAIALRREYGSKVSLGEGERVGLELMHTIDVHPAIASLRAAGAFELSDLMSQWQGENDLVDWEFPDRWLSDGVELALKTRTLQAISTPGHTRGHLVFYDAQANVLFGGDHVLPHITPSIGLELEPTVSPLRDYLGSLRLMQTLPDATLLPAHGPAGMSTHTRVQELLDHHEQRLAATAAAVAGGAETGFEVANVLTWTRHRRRYRDLDVFNQTLATQETMAHLEVLVERGLLSRHVADTVVHFTTG